MPRSSTVTDAEKVMAAVDRMAPAMRALVYEYGFVIVSAMIADGYRNAKVLRPILETWRARRQDEWLQTNYVQPKAIQSIERALERP